MSSYLISIKKQFEYYKSLGDKTFAQISNKDIHWQYNKESNSIAIIVKHIIGNMISRWTNFRTEDGEKEWRHRDSEFEDAYISKAEMLLAWEKGWTCLFEVLNSLTEKELENIIYIRNQGHTITEALNRQLSHYCYHIGQLVYVARMIKNKEWLSLSIPKGNSKDYNNNKFSSKKIRKHFTDDL